jgi:anti-sigma B factor antagonist
MKLQYNEFENNIRMIKLNGRLDIMGTNAVDVKFAGYCSGENVRVVVDLSGVEYIASIGIRLLTSNAKSLASRGGKMVLLNPIEEVRNVLEITGILGVIPTFDDFESARVMLSA